MSEPLNLSIGFLLERFRAGRLRPAEVVGGILERIPAHAATAEPELDPPETYAGSKALRVAP